MFGLEDREADADGASSEPLEPNDDVFSTLMYDCLLNEDVDQDVLPRGHRRRV